MQPPSLSLLYLTALLAMVLFTTIPISAAPEDSNPLDTTRPRLRCKCHPQQPCWPTESIWSAFNQTVGGRLIATMPVARACHPPNYDQTKCDEIKQNYYFDTWRQQQPGAIQYTYWETFKGQGCLLNQASPCVQGAVPLFSVNASSVTDVQETVRFAAKHNIRLVVKNTGHDFFGRSTAPASINLWVYFMKKINVVDSFVPEGAPQGTEGWSAVIFESGAVWEDAYRAVDAHNRTVVGGAAQTVGTSGGYCLSGGHGPLSLLHGLCVDNVLQYKVVTADGELRIANAYQNTDLFWAMRGGGPGFGVVVEAVYRTHGPVKINKVFAVIYSEDRDEMDQVMKDFFARQINWTDAGWGGYTSVTRNFMALSYLLPDVDAETACTSFKPFLDHVRTLPNVTVANDTCTQFPSYWEYFRAMMPLLPEANAGYNAILGSRLIPRALFESQRGADLLTSTMHKIQDDMGSAMDQYQTISLSGGYVTKGTSTETSVLPAWRKSIMLVLTRGSWNDTTPYAEQLAIQRAMTASTNRLRKITPGSGTYMNEADPNEPNFQQNFFGANYPRLKSIKNKYDPRGLFVCRRCVGSEDWNSDELCPRRC